MTRKTQNTYIKEKLDQIHLDVKEVREKDIPDLKVEIAVVKERAKNQARIIAAIGGLITMAVSSAIAYIF